ncbi:MAG: hypothetical protein BMS9Abin23_0088 [Thermodesulfobacteriota bacterium]|nr:MAG: hypothetical protein BMS9Abin23_0088 [Thermodesulfobacteriota bacterium]
MKKTPSSALRVLIALTLFFALLGCTSATSQRDVDKIYKPRRRSRAIEVYSKFTLSPETQRRLGKAFKSLDEIPVYRRIGSILAWGPTRASMASIIKKAQKKARALGGDAIILERSEKKKVYDDGLFKAYKVEVYALVVRFQ